MSVLDDWLKERALTLDFMSRYGVKFDQFNNRLVAPVRSMRGTFCFDMYRNFNDDKPKYTYNPEKCRISAVLYGFEMDILKSKAIIIVEGFADVLALKRVGLKAVMSPLTSQLGVVQLAYLKVFGKPVIVWGDGDEAGQDFISQVDNMPFRAKGFTVSGQDPASFVASGGDVKSVIAQPYREVIA